MQPELEPELIVALNYQDLSQKYCRHVVLSVALKSQELSNQSRAEPSVAMSEKSLSHVDCVESELSERRMFRQPELICSQS